MVRAPDYITEGPGLKSHLGLRFFSECTLLLTFNIIIFIFLLFTFFKLPYTIFMCSLSETCNASLCNSEFILRNDLTFTVLY